MNTSAGSATQRAYDFIRDRLKNRELPPGARLVTRNLAKELGTSLNPVREALNRLSSQGLVQHVPGAGTFVHQLDAQRVKDLYGTRTAIETYAAAEACGRISEEQLNELQRLCDGWTQLAKSLRGEGRTELSEAEREQWSRDENRYHTIILEAAGNRILAEMASEKRLLSTMFDSMHPAVLKLNVQTVEQVARTHGELVASLRSGNAEVARNQVAGMLEVGCENFLRQMESSN